MATILFLQRQIGPVTSGLFLCLATAVGVQAEPVGGGSAPAQSGSHQDCLVGGPEGDRPVTRQEFAMGLNICLKKVEQTLPLQRRNLATRADFKALIQRQLELNAEIRALNSRVGKMLGLPAAPSESTPSTESTDANQ
ncbi:hypothetical protein BST81_14645 [Leptolyngbya sp. 'hensonii']|uniref:hypothetical protein n=1 Tax=Leptolyngbya sp. 'hensonii' TaxID=1922337 RepID=UPI00094FC234|nr:hypothetical protein [Leptolyngbya sp. 'hensonii']OLP17564.1 hypothetical protein BST81_14645 [Leptolyngbya sp. 'hensonii']